jgi:serine/threonine-protein kinase
MGSVAVANLIETLRACQLLSAAQLAELSQPYHGRLPEPETLGEELQRRGWLTGYQVKQLLGGNGSQLVLGSYVLLDRLGEGGMGQVYKARHRKLDRIVALKIIRKERLDNPAAVKRFQREIQAAAQLDHPNIVRAFDADCAGDVHFFVMEYVEGLDLGRTLKQRGPLPIAEAADYVRQAALGLQHAAERGLVHRDIKPSNLLIADCRLQIADSAPQSAIHNPQSAIVKILDMGLARVYHVADGGGSTSSITQEGTVMGTPDYIAPEQAMSSHTVDVRADLYSLGCTFYHLITGQVPFPGGSLTEKLLKHQLQAPVPPETIRPEVPLTVSQVIGRLLAKRPEDRFQSPAELAAVLSALIQDESLARGGQPAPGPFPLTALADPTLGTLEAGDEPTPNSALDALRARRRARRQSLQRWLAIAAVAVAGIIVLAVICIALFVGGVKKDRSSDGLASAPTSLADALSFNVDAARLWQDTHVDVAKATVHTGKPITIRVKGKWKRGPKAAECSSAGDPRASRERNVAPEAPAMCLLGRIGSDQPFKLDLPANVVYPSRDGRLFVQANDLDLEDNSGSLTIEVVGGTRMPADASPPGATPIQEAEFERQRLSSEAETAFKVLSGAQPVAPAEIQRLRQELLQFRSKYGGTLQCAQAATLLKRLPSPLDALDPARLPSDLAREWSNAGMEPPKELAAVVRTPGQLCFAPAPDGDRLATGATDGSVSLWDLAQPVPKELKTFQAHKSAVGSLGFNPDGRLLATAADEAAVRIWDVATATERLAIPTLRSEGVGALAFSPDGKLITFRSRYQKAVQLWETQTGKPHRTLPGCEQDITSILFHPGGQSLVSCIVDGPKVAVHCNARTGREICACMSPEGSGGCYHAEFTPDGKLLAAAVRGGHVRVWNSSTGQQLWAVHAGSEGLTTAMNPDGQTFLTGHKDGYMILWSIGGERLRDWQFPSPVRGLALAPDGRHVIVGLESGWLLILRLAKPA